MLALVLRTLALALCLPSRAWQLAAAADICPGMAPPAGPDGSSIVPVPKIVQSSSFCSKPGRCITPLPCLRRPSVISPALRVNYTSCNQAPEYCAGNGIVDSWIHTRFDGFPCGLRDGIKWYNISTLDPPPQFKKLKCNGWVDTTPCGGRHLHSGGPGEWGAVDVPGWFCPPAGFERALTGGTYSNKSPQPGNLTVDQCAAKCTGSTACKAFSVSDQLGNTTACALYLGALEPPFQAVRYIYPSPSVFLTQD